MTTQADRPLLDRNARMMLENARAGYAAGTISREMLEMIAQAAFRGLGLTPSVVTSLTKFFVDDIIETGTSSLFLERDPTTGQMVDFGRGEAGLPREEDQPFRDEGQVFGAGEQDEAATPGQFLGGPSPVTGPGVSVGLSLQDLLDRLRAGTIPPNEALAAATQIYQRMSPGQSLEASNRIAQSLLFGRDYTSTLPISPPTGVSVGGDERQYFGGPPPIGDESLSEDPFFGGTSKEIAFGKVTGPGGSVGGDEPMTLAEIKSLFVKGRIERTQAIGFATDFFLAQGHSIEKATELGNQFDSLAPEVEAMAPKPTFKPPVYDEYWGAAGPGVGNGTPTADQRLTSMIPPMGEARRIAFGEQPPQIQFARFLNELMSGQFGEAIATPSAALRRGLQRPADALSRLFDIQYAGVPKVQEEGAGDLAFLNFLRGRQAEGKLAPSVAESRQALQTMAEALRAQPHLEDSLTGLLSPTGRRQVLMDPSEPTGWGSWAQPKLLADLLVGHAPASLRGATQTAIERAYTQQQAMKPELPFLLFAQEQGLF